MIAEELRETWRAVAQQARQVHSITAKALPDHPSLLIGAEPNGAIHLLIPTNEDVPTKTYGALSVKHRMLEETGAAKQYIDLACSDPNLREAFLWLASEIVGRTAGIGASPTRVITALEDFKALFTRNVSMTRSSLIGLVGELEILERLSGRHSGWQALDWWVRDAQDYASGCQCLEVKTTEAAGGGAITVHGLEQFSSDRRTYLVVLRAQEVADNNSVPARLERLVAAGVPRPELTKKVAEVFEPDSTLASLGFDMEPLGWWQVTKHFPFLLPEDLPDQKRMAIGSLSYSVAIAAFPAGCSVVEEEVADGFLAGVHDR